MTLLRVTDDSDRAELAEALTHCCRTAIRAPHVFGSKDHPSAWDKSHQRLDELGGRRPQMPDFTRLQQRILDRIIERDCGYDTPCWISNRAAQPNGYTKIGIDNRTHLTHRVAYEQWIGPIPEGLQVDHLCTMRACCNPDHLEAVTPRVNTLRSNSVSGIAARKTHCHRGHPLKGANLYVRPDKPTHRGCRTCRNEADQRRHAADRLRKSA